MLRRQCPVHIRSRRSDSKAVSVATNKATIGVYRGVGLPIGVFVTERLLDLGARKLGLDPAEVRLRNMIRKEEHPYTTILGTEIESGSHRESLRMALDMLGYQQFREHQQRLREQGRYVGVGIGCYVEGTAPNSGRYRRRDWPSPATRRRLFAWTPTAR